MKRILFLMLLVMMGSMSYAEDINIQFRGSAARVKQFTKDSVKVAVKGSDVYVESQYVAHKLSLVVTGKSNDGRLSLKTAGKAKVKLEGLTLTSREGAPLCIKNKKKVEIVAANGTENTLTITACNDTANNKSAVIWAKDKLLFSGKGTLNVIATGDGCRGIKTKDDITIEELTLNVKTSGDNLGEKPFGMGGFPDFGGEMPSFDDFPGFGGMRPGSNDSTKRGGFPVPPEGFSFPNFGEGFPNFGEGFPNFGEGMPDFGEMPDFGGGMFPFGEDNDSTREGGFGGFGGKHKYVASTKGIASKSKITINSGNVTVRTSTAGAEGIEGKEGVVFNGGKVDVLTTDDAINANATIEFNGADVIAWSKGNDAVDSNPKGGFFPPFGGNNEQDNDPAIVITGGSVYAMSQVGSPEEGLDGDFAPIVIDGGTVFSVGGGMGEMPSVPTNETAHQPTALLIGVPITKDEPIQFYDGSGKQILTVVVPFSFRRSASLVSSAAFKLGGTYTVKTKGYDKTFTFSEPFTSVR